MHCTKRCVCLPYMVLRLWQPKLCYLGGFKPFEKIIPSLKLTYPLKIDPWKRRFLLETIIFRGELLVLGRVVTLPPMEVENGCLHSYRKQNYAIFQFHCCRKRKIAIISPSIRVKIKDMDVSKNGGTPKMDGL